MIEPPADQKKAPSHQDDDASTPGFYLIPDTAQPRDEQDDFYDLVGDSQRDEQSFVIAREIAEIERQRA